MSWTNEHPPHTGLGRKLFICIGLAREFRTKFVFHSILWESPNKPFFFWPTNMISVNTALWVQELHLRGGMLVSQERRDLGRSDCPLSLHYFPLDLGLGRSAPVVGNLLASGPSLWSKEWVGRVSPSTFVCSSAMAFPTADGFYQQMLLRMDLQWPSEWGPRLLLLRNKGLLMLCESCVVFGTQTGSEKHGVCRTVRRACVLSPIWLFETPWTVAARLLCPWDSPRQEYWSGLSFPSPGDLSRHRDQTTSLASPALACGFFTDGTTQEAPRKAWKKLSRVWLFATSWTVASPAPLSMESKGIVLV